MIINPKNKNRIDSSILKKIKRGSRVLACGVGDGSEVQYLRLKKINAYGIDPSRIKKNQIKKIEKYIQRTEMSSKIFGKLKFDFIYAFEVIEHVGCKEFGTFIKKDFLKQRKFFLKACIKKLNKNGSAFITTLNKNFLIDIGHRHRYHLPGRIFSFFFKNIGLSLPFMKNNFLMNYQDIRIILNSMNSKELNFKYKFLDMSNYPSVARKKNHNIFSYLFKIYLKIANKKIFRETFFNPLIGIEIKKKN